MRWSGRGLVPGAATLGGLLLAFWAITMAGQGRYEAAAWILFAAACADILDGGLARALGAITPFGQQLDSLVDVVAAGVGPAVLVHQVYFQDRGFAGVVVAFAWVAFVAVRLARYNTSVTVDRFHFVGVPCPIAATVLSQYVVFSRATWGDDGSPWVCAALIAVLGLLMISRVPFWKSSTVMPRHFLHHPFGPGVAATAVLSIPFPGQALFVGTSLGVVVAVALHVLPAPAGQQEAGAGLATMEGIDAVETRIAPT